MRVSKSNTDYQTLYCFFYDTEYLIRKNIWLRGLWGLRGSGDAGKVKKRFEYLMSVGYVSCLHRHKESLQYLLGHHIMGNPQRTTLWLQNEAFGVSYLKEEEKIP